MNILLVNDDGIYASGIRTLAEELSKNHTVTIAAPNREMSGTGHSVTFWNYLHYVKLNVVEGVDCYAITGTPADCAKFGAEYLLKDRKVDLLISGINNGWNLGTDVIYSGTVNAAAEGAVLGIPSIAVSQKDGLRDYRFTARFVSAHLNRLCELLPEDSSYILSINVPSDDEDAIKGVKFATIGTRKYLDRYEDCGLKGYYITGEPVEEESNGPETDVFNVRAGYITISPVKSDFNDYDAFVKLKDTRL